MHKIVNKIVNKLFGGEFWSIENILKTHITC